MFQNYNPPRIISIDMTKQRDPKHSSTQFPTGFDLAGKAINKPKEFQSGNQSRLGQLKNSTKQQKRDYSNNRDYSRQSQRAVIGVLRQVEANADLPDEGTKHGLATGTSLENCKSNDKAINKSGHASSGFGAAEALPNDETFLSGQKPILSNRPKAINQKILEMDMSGSMHTEYGKSSQRDLERSFNHTRTLKI